MNLDLNLDPCSGDDAVASSSLPLASVSPTGPAAVSTPLLDLAHALDRTNRDVVRALTGSRLHGGASPARYVPWAKTRGPGLGKRVRGEIRIRDGVDPATGQIVDAATRIYVLTGAREVEALPPSCRGDYRPGDDGGSEHPSARVRSAQPPPRLMELRLRRDGPRVLEPMGVHVVPVGLLEGLVGNKEGNEFAQVMRYTDILVVPSQSQDGCERVNHPMVRVPQGHSRASANGADPQTGGVRNMGTGTPCRQRSSDLFVCKGHRSEDIAGEHRWEKEGGGGLCEGVACVFACAVDTRLSGPTPVGERRQRINACEPTFCRSSFSPSPNPVVGTIQVPSRQNPGSERRRVVHPLWQPSRPGPFCPSITNHFGATWITPAIGYLGRFFDCHRWPISRRLWWQKIATDAPRILVRLTCRHILQTSRGRESRGEVALLRSGHCPAEAENQLSSRES